MNLPFIVLWVCTKHKYNSVIVNVFLAAHSNMYRFKRWVLLCVDSGSPVIRLGCLQACTHFLKGFKKTGRPSEISICKCEPFRSCRDGLG